MDAPLNREERDQLHQAVLAAFPWESGLEQLFYFELEHNYRAVRRGDNYGDVVANLIQLMEGEGWTRQFLTAARKRNPGNLLLRTFAEEYERRRKTAAPDNPNTASNSTSDPLGSAQDTPTTPPGSNSDSPQSAPNTTASGAAATRPHSGSPSPDVLARAFDFSKLKHSDKDRLIDILIGVPQILAGPPAAVPFLRSMGWSVDMISNFTWQAPPRTIAQQILDESERYGVAPKDPYPGFKLLGLLFSQVILDQAVGFDQARYLATVVVRYNLIDLDQVDRTDRRMQALLPFLQLVPEPLSNAEARAALETTLRQAQGFLDRYLDARWLDDGAQAAQSVCRVEVPVSGRTIPLYGTGFLLGPDLVLTNYHVVEAVIAGEEGKSDSNGLRGRRGDVVLRFGYRAAEGVVPAAGQEYRLVDSTGWCVDASPVQDLDYALLRVNGKPGLQMLGDRQRGYLQPPWGTIKPHDPLFIIQHPLLHPNDTQTAPLKVVLAYDAVAEVTAKRVTYFVNTESGASGSPCFTADWKLTALHHSGAAAGGPGSKTNEGIPIGPILDRPEVQKALAGL